MLAAGVHHQRMEPAALDQNLLAFGSAEAIWPAAARVKEAQAEIKKTGFMAGGGLESDRVGLEKSPPPRSTEMTLGMSGGCLAGLLKLRS